LGAIVSDDELAEAAAVGFDSADPSSAGFEASMNDHGVIGRGVDEGVALHCVCSAEDIFGGTDGYGAAVGFLIGVEAVGEDFQSLAAGGYGSGNAFSVAAVRASGNDGISEFSRLFTDLAGEGADFGFDLAASHDAEEVGRGHFAFDPEGGWGGISKVGSPAVGVNVVYGGERLFGLDMGSSDLYEIRVFEKDGFFPEAACA